MKVTRELIVMFKEFQNQTHRLSLLENTVKRMIIENQQMDKEMLQIFQTINVEELVGKNAQLELRDQFLRFMLSGIFDPEGYIDLMNPPENIGEEQEGGDSA